MKKYLLFFMMMFHSFSFAELEDFLLNKKEVNNEQKMYIYLYKNFALKFTMKKILN